jgi:hypothetical protein
MESGYRTVWTRIVFFIVKQSLPGYGHTVRMCPRIPHRKEANLVAICSKSIPIYRRCAIAIVTVTTQVTSEFYRYEHKNSTLKHLFQHKPGKPPNKPTSYWSVSLLPITSKVFKKLLLKRTLPLVEDNSLIPTHQFDFRQGNSTTGHTRSCKR